jgi:hypothetical protein
MGTLVPNEEFTRPASEEQIARTVAALRSNGMRAMVVDTADEARACVMDLIPSGAQVYDAPSRTLALIGLAAEIEHATRFQPVRAQLAALDRATQQQAIRRLRAGADVLVGSVHAITEQGQVLIASALGSQLGPAASDAGAVIWVVGTQKLVHTLDDGFRRIREYCFPLEDARTRQAYGQASAINKILIVNAEMQPDRITIVLVKQNLGF